MDADGQKRQELTDRAKAYADDYHSSLTEMRVLGQALALLGSG